MLNKEFITVIPEDRISDIAYVESEIIKNRKYSTQNREEILDYAKEFDWVKIVEKFYLPNMESIIFNG